jgi:branched-chain amino acid transport system substrate-binding protein
MSKGIRTPRTLVIAGLSGFVLGLVLAAPALGQNEQFIPMTSYRVGPYAAGGSGTFGGFIDYLDMLNKRDGGINGVKLTWEECETE